MNQVAMTIDMSSMVDAVRLPRDCDDDEERAERACIVAIHPVLSRHMDINMCHSLLNQHVDPRGVVRRALCLLVTVSPGREVLWFFDWYASFVATTGREKAHALLDLLLKYVLLPLTMHRVGKGLMSIDSLAPVVFFAPHLRLEPCVMQTLANIVIEKFPTISAKSTFFWINNFVCQCKSSDILNVYIDYVVDRGTMSTTCANMMVNNRMTAALDHGDTIGRLVDSWLRDPHQPILTLLSDVMRCSNYATVKVHDYLTSIDRRHHDSTSTGRLVKAVFDCMPFLTFDWKMFNTEDDATWSDMISRATQREKMLHQNMRG